MRKISGHTSKQRIRFFLLILSEFCINHILGRRTFSLRKFDLFSLVSLRTMIGMRLVEREADGQVGGADGQVGGGDKHRLVYSMTVRFAP